MTAYNESSVIGSIIAKINRSYSVYVIDDGSTDNTHEISKLNGAKVISHSINLGQGNAAITMFRFATSSEYDFIIHMDADGQHDPQEIPKFVSKFEEINADIIQGSRVLGTDYKKAPLARKLFLSPLTYLLNKLTGYHMTDSMCGFRGHSVQSLKRVYHLFERMVASEYLASEMWIKFAKAGLKVVEIPITLSERKHGYSYKGLFRYGMGVVSTVIRSKLDTYKHEMNNN